MDPTSSVHQFCANLGKSAMETLAMIRQEFRKESMSHTRMLKRLGLGQTEKGKTGEEHVLNFL
jgi:hypothetical protein